MKNDRWTNKDEAELQRLIKRKNDLMTINRQPLLLLVESEGFASMSASEIVDSLIHNADSFRDALEPFDSGVRCL